MNRATALDPEWTKWANLAGVDEIVNVHDAKTNFSKLLARVESGEEIVIARSGRPCARLVPIEEAVPVLGSMRDRWPNLPDEFFEPLTEDDLEAWGG